nr:diguanylate cyclase [Variovorax boronicumulans]
MPMRPLWQIAAWTFVGALLIGLALFGATWASLNAARQSDLARARAAADNMAQGLGIEIASELRLVENALTTIALDYRHPTDTRAVAERLRGAVREQHALIPFASALRATDASGTVVVGLPRERDAVSVGDRDYFALARQSARPVISEPLFSRVTQEWGIVVALRLESQTGEFGGIVYAVLLSSHFQHLFAQLSVGESGAISLRTDTLRLVARHSAADPGSTRGLGGNDVSDELRRAFTERPDAGAYVTATALDQVERITAYRRVAGYPLTVLVGFSAENYLTPWSRSAERHWAIASATFGLVVAVLAFMLRQHRRQFAISTYASQLARQQNLILNNDMIGMVRVQDRRIVWANRAMERILGYGPATLPGQSTRILYPSDAAFEDIERTGYPSLRRDGRFRTQVRMKTSAGRQLWVDLSGAALNETESIWMIVDIDVLKLSEQQAQHLARHDPLTGLANRRLFEEHLRRCTAQARRTDQAFALCYMDLDGFKPVNDRHGHEAGDAVLRAVGARLANELRANDTVARLGGDEFAWILAGATAGPDVRPVLQRCMDAVRLPIAVGAGQVVEVGCSVGVALSTRCGPTEQDILAAADAAMYAAKQNGGCSFVLAGPGADLPMQR